MLCTMPVFTTVKRLWNNQIFVKEHINKRFNDVYVQYIYNFLSSIQTCSTLTVELT